MLYGEVGAPLFRGVEAPHWRLRAVDIRELHPHRGGFRRHLHVERRTLWRAVRVRRIAGWQFEHLVDRPIAKAVMHLFDGAAIADDLREIDGQTLPFAKGDPARPKLIEDLLLLVGER